MARRETLGDLKEGGESEDGSQSTAGEGSDLGGTGLDDRLGRGRSGLDNSRGGVVADAGVADNGRRGVDWLGDGARAVEGQGGGLGDGVGLVGVGDDSRLWAVGDVGRDNLGGVGHVAVSNGASGGSDKEGDDGELHFD